MQLDQRKKRRLFLTYAATLLFIFLFFVLPLPYYSISPGTLVDMGEVVDAGQDREHFYAVSVNVYVNRYAQLFGVTRNTFKVNPLIFLVSKLRKDADLFRIPKGYNLSSEQIIAFHDEEQAKSEELALRLALDELGLSGREVDISFGELSGSSRGLMLALELVQQLGDKDLIQGLKIAGSGELDENGTVVAVGNTRQKVITAEREGVDLLILPLAERVETNIEVVYVTNLSDAISRLD